MNEKLVNSLLHRGVAEVIDAKHLAKRLQSGQPLRAKLGIDPSTPHLHIGHAVPLRKLRQFQDAGHTAVLIIGDYTAQIGDPTGKGEARVMLTAEATKTNAKDYLEQAYKILDRDKTEVHFQSEWFEHFSLRDVIELMATTTVNHMVSHETFGNRLKDGVPLHVHELLYPLLQGYDSVAVKADVELGGIDQKFNILMGRAIQRAHNLPEQDVMLFSYLPGTDGQAKMSKSLGNTINLTDAPDAMFGKVMSIPDELIVTYFELATRVPESEVQSVAQKLKNPETNPRDLKFLLAYTLVSEYHSEEAAKQAGDNFNRQFRDKQIPDDIEVLRLASDIYAIGDILVNRTTLLSSKSEFRRLVEQRGIKKNGHVVTDTSAIVSPDDGETVLLQIGSRRFLRLRWKERHG